MEAGRGLLPKRALACKERNDRVKSHIVLGGLVNFLGGCKFHDMVN
jgi:hypothetical protein